MNLQLYKYYIAAKLFFVTIYHRITQHKGKAIKKLVWCSYERKISKLANFIAKINNIDSL